MSILEGKSILITGGTGSFGKKFVRMTLDRLNPRRLVIFSRDEMKQWDMGMAYESDPRVRFFIGDVRDRERLGRALDGVDFVVHAAATKIVPTAEYNPFECVKTNILGAMNLIDVCIDRGIQRVVALSTDKASNPINLYGATKLASDKLFVAGNAYAGLHKTRFSVVRYGNVVGSRGSVVPLYQGLIGEGAKSLPITDPRMTRFLITLAQGTGFVLSSLEMMRGGEIFVPKIPSVRIVDLARALAPGLPHEHIGIRPGEKLHEVMITEDDARATLDLGDRYVICPPNPRFPVSRYLDLGARPVQENFRYSSETNPEWLEGASILGLVASGGKH